jgi:hypothetical protein
MVLAGIAGIFFVAILGATATVGLRTGSLAPLFPEISRAETPVKFWFGIGSCAAIILAFALNLVLRR